MATTPAGIFFDDSALQAGRAVQRGPEVPIWDPVMKVNLWSQPWRCRASYFKGLDLSTPRAGGGILVNESVPSLVLGDVVEWTRLYSEVPPPRIETAHFIHTLQVIRSIDPGEILEEQITTFARVELKYFNTTTPHKIPILRKQLLKVIDGILQVIVVTGPTNEKSQPKPGTGGVAEDSDITRWKGNIWERRTPYVQEDVVIVPFGGIAV